MLKSKLNSTFGVLILGLFSFLFSFGVFAQDVSPSPSESPSPTKRPSTLMRQENREELKDQMEARREDMKKQMESRREELKQMAEQKREAAKDAMERKHEELKKRLEKVRDQRKKSIVERIDKRMDELNANRLEHFSKALDHLEEILEKIIARTDRAAQRGLDVGPVHSAVDAANAAIDAARSLIAEQSGKTYSILISSEENLRKDVGVVRQTLHADLKKIFEAVKAARKTVHDVATALAKIHKEQSPNPSPSATVSGSPATSPSSSPSPSTSSSPAASASASPTP